MAMQLIVVRRATLEDLGRLMELWRSMNFDPEPLVKRLTEFQVAELRDGTFVGAIGLQILEKQGLIHSEGFADFGYSEHAREAVWERLNALAANHGLLRLWTREQAPFWNHCGMRKADPEALEKLPAAWQAAGEWRTIKLRDDVESLMAADKEFALFMQAEKARTARAIRRAKMLKTLVGLIAFAVMAIALAAAFLLIQRSQALRGLGR